VDRGIVAAGLFVYLVFAMLKPECCHDTRGIVQLVLYLVVLIALSKPLGDYMARVYEGKATMRPDPGAVERLVYRACGVQADTRRAGRPTRSGCCSSIWRASWWCTRSCDSRRLPWNPESLPAASPDLAFNTR